LTDSPGDGSPTICVTPSHRKIGNKLATLELYVRKENHFRMVACRAAREPGCQSAATRSYPARQVEALDQGEEPQISGGGPGDGETFGKSGGKLSLRAGPFGPIGYRASWSCEQAFPALPSESQRPAPQCVQRQSQRKGATTVFLLLLTLQVCPVAANADRSRRPAKGKMVMHLRNNHVVRARECKCAWPAPPRRHTWAGQNLSNPLQPLKCAAVTP
jgi:hypothetical protein